MRVFLDQQRPAIQQGQISQIKSNLMALADPNSPPLLQKTYRAMDTASHSTKKASSSVQEAATRKAPFGSRLGFSNTMSFFL